MSDTDALTPGGVLFWLTVTESLLVRPVVVLVAVTIYLPGLDTVMMFWPIAKPVHVMVVLAVVEVALKVTEGLAHVIVPTGSMVRLGGVLARDTVTESFFIQPLVAFWAVT